MLAERRLTAAAALVKEKQEVAVLGSRGLLAGPSLQDGISNRSRWVTHTLFAWFRYQS